MENARKRNDEFLIDVREPEEYLAQRIPGSINLPLSAWDGCAPKMARQFPKAHVAFTCLGGTRAKLAADKWQALTGATDISIIEGGLKGHIARGGRVDGAGRDSGISLFRQVQMIVGPAVLFSSLAVLAGFPKAAWISAFVGTGLSLAGYTGFCGMAVLLSRAPWNRSRPQTACASACETTSELLP